MSRPLIEYGRAGDRLDIPVFDMHAHVSNTLGCDVPGLDATVRQMDRLGIDLAAVSSARALLGDVVHGNNEVADALRRYPGRFLGYCHVSAHYPELMISELERCFTLGFSGVKLYQVGVDYDDPRYAPAWDFAVERGVPVLAHTWGNSLTGYERAAEQHPTVTCFAAHAGSGFAYQTYIDAARRAPNFYLDLTYSREHTNMIEHFVAEVGADRIVWGSDSPLFSMSQQLSKVLFARISDEEKRKILYANAARAFTLPERVAGPSV